MCVCCICICRKVYLYSVARIYLSASKMWFTELLLFLYNFFFNHNTLCCFLQALIFAAPAKVVGGTRAERRFFFARTMQLDL